MVTLCLLQSGIPGIVPLITSISATTTTSRANDHVHAHQSHVTTVRRSNKSSMFSRFIGSSARNNCLAAVNDAFTAENADRTVKEGDGQNGNWVFKVFDLNSVWKGEQESGDNDGDECDVCRVDEEVDDENEDEEIRFDRESFSRMLRRVTLVEARMYAHMSHLGNLAYSIPNIKVYFIINFLLCFHVFLHFFIHKECLGIQISIKKSS